MNILLLSLPVKGLIWLLLLFAVCFVGIHLVILARLGWEYQKSATTPNLEKPKEEEKKAPAEKPEPIYYIVERKTKRAKPNYGPPKQINFKPQD